MTTSLSDKEIKELGYQIKNEDIIFMKDDRLDVAKIETEGTQSETDVLIDEKWKNSIQYDYEKTLEDGTYLYIWGNTLSGYQKIIKRKDDNFQDTYTYYPSGNLKMKVNSYVNRFNNALQYWYDEDGNLEKYTNHNAPYLFSWKNILDFLEVNKIETKDIYQISREVKNTEPKWYVGQILTRGLEPEKVKMFTLDGKTGDVLKTEIIDVTRHLD